jgi:hypothetical protein
MIGSMSARKTCALLVRATFGLAFVLVAAGGVAPNTFTWGS